MKNSSGFFSAFWIAGWLFTIGYTNLVWWKIILDIVVWLFYLDDAVLATGQTRISHLTCRHI